MNQPRIRFEASKATSPKIIALAEQLGISVSDAGNLALQLFFSGNVITFDKKMQFTLPGTVDQIEDELEQLRLRLQSIEEYRLSILQTIKQDK